MHADAPAAFEAIETVETVETSETIATEQRLVALATPVPIPVATPLAPLATPLTTKQHLARLIDRTDERVERWLADHEEVARLDTWIASERARVERELSQEEGRSGRRLMGELVAFEEQLGLRLREQEERIARWWQEADRIAKERFVALGPAPLRHYPLDGKAPRGRSRSRDECSRLTGSPGVSYYTTKLINRKV